MKPEQSPSASQSKPTSSFDFYDDDDETSLGQATHLERADHPSVGCVSHDVEFARSFGRKQIKITKYFVLVSMLVAAGLVSAGTYVFLKREENDDYRNTYQHFIDTVHVAVDFHVRNVFTTMESLAMKISATADSLDMTFPYVTPPAFEATCNAARRQAGFELLMFVPQVKIDQLDEWRNYSVAHQSWLDESRQFALETSSSETLQPSDYMEGPILEGVFFAFPDQGIPFAFAPEYDAEKKGPFFPIWMQSPPPFRPNIINFDMGVTGAELIDAVQESQEGLMTRVTPTFRFFAVDAIKEEDHEAYHTSLVDVENTNSTTTSSSSSSSFSAFDHPHTIMFYPIFSRPNNFSSDFVGVVIGLLPWDRYLINLLPEGIQGITCVLRNSCQQSFTYKLDGTSAIYVGEGDFHDPAYDATEVVFPFYSFRDAETVHQTPGHCTYSFHVYSSWEFEKDYRSNLVAALTVAVTTTFAFMILSFYAYEWLVRRRNERVINVATRTDAIVSSLFPSVVRDRLLQQHHESLSASSSNRKSFPKSFVSSGVGPEDEATRQRLKTFLSVPGGDKVVGTDSNASDTQATGLSDIGVSMFTSQPIADLFPETTILFGDICGFTAWSSTREPQQVFTLLETIFRAFDEIALRRRVYKVETVGDCYVAVCGLPDARPDHAVVMSRFARDCMLRVMDLVTKLEVLLGPDTADLSMRFGMHSGPVTAGVLRGERARFQLFGDTMNTASRMESTGKKGFIQLSQDTADLLVQAGKGSWFVKREDRVVAKGKGEMQTYWLTTMKAAQSISADVSTSHDFENEENSNTKRMRLINWNTEVWMKLLRDIEIRRRAIAASRPGTLPPSFGATADEEDGVSPHTIPLDEVQEIIHLPTFAPSSKLDPKSVVLESKVEGQVRTYIDTVSHMYRDTNSFHNFEHASHVTSSVVKLMKRIVAPDLSDAKLFSGDRASTLHDHTYGITSDPLTQFACVFSALIHDADHTGVPNTQIAKEDPHLAQRYNGRSIAEQKSVDLAWQLLMGDEFDELRAVIFKTPTEKRRFRQLVVNSVMATDIVDRELKYLRDLRWDKAFMRRNTGRNAVGSGGDGSPVESFKDAIDRKATIVIEHLIQASDVSHTMQHWHIYRKWNLRLFREMRDAYMENRAVTDPASFWYEGELDFFDFYIIPLARKLKDCGVFGASSDEYLNYAMKNRQEWQLRGKEIVAEMLEAMDGDENADDLQAEVTVHEVNDDEVVEEFKDDRPSLTTSTVDKDDNDQALDNMV